MSYSYRRPRVTLVWPAPLDYDEVPDPAECEDLVQHKLPADWDELDHATQRAILFPNANVTVSREVTDDLPF